LSRFKEKDCLGVDEVDFLGMLPLLLVLGGIIFLIYFLPFLAKDLKKITDSTELK
jgi:hypothetical protein